ncbi:MAG: 3-oxoacyl-[acyl-carrier-protein] reductase [Rhizobiales bacterium TMED168]|nr:MAG: 3-oxoacyl-[acyl-carrier-protein] reductase [Rhizobiales bacterium TMED168]|tara:strand:- start:50112 stop:50849 length:738 start_codon:yes stop_codon:yes gene_type:complete
MIDLKGKKVLLTGASGGLGKAIAIELAKNGADVCLTGRNQIELEDLQKTIGGKTEIVLSDLSNSIGITDLANTAQEKMGQIDILINNAGITRDNLFMRMSDDDWNDVMNINLNSIFKLTKLLIKGMIKRRFGRIINITSVIGVAGGAGQSNYSASKAGIIALSKSLAQEVGSRSVTVNSIAPGFIETNMTAGLNDDRKEQILESISMGRLGKPEDISGAVCFLASDKASYITGQTLHINGGMLMI